MRARMLAVFLGAVATWAAAGCGGDSDSGPKDQFLSDLCDILAPCCEAAGRPSDGQQCRAIYDALTSDSAFDATSSDACLAEVRALENSCDTSSWDAPSCRKVFASSGGAKQPGQACNDDNDCAPSDEGEVSCESEYVDGATIKQCQVRIPGKQGSTPCVGTVDGNLTYYSGVGGIPAKGYLCAVADGLSCNGQTQACEALADVGEPCGDCVRSAYCEFATGTCKARAAVGAACADDEECAADAYCEPGGSVCAPRRAVGEACALNAECVWDECTNQKCAPKSDLSLALICGTP